MLTRTIRLSRDAATGNVLVRRTAMIGRACSNCGKHRLHRGHIVLSLYQYGTEYPDGRTEWHKGFYCSKGCHDAYQSST